MTSSRSDFDSAVVGVGDHSQQPDTLTEKVDRSKNGWEMWVADENLMNELQPNHHRKSTSISSQPSPLPSPLLPSKQNSNNNNKNFNFNFSPNQIQSISSPNQTNISAVNQEHNLSPSSPNQSNFKTATASNQSFSPTNTTQLQLDPISSPITQQATSPKMNSTRYSTSALPPQASFVDKNQNLTEPITKSPQPHLDSINAPYTHAFELNDQKVTRVTPLTSSGWSIPNSQSIIRPLPLPISVPQPTPISVPQPLPVAEVCVECMMRDRDMADVDVLGPGVWERKSDADFQDAMAAEAQLDETDELESLKSRSNGGITNTSREGSSLCNDSLSSGLHRTNRKKRLGFGSPLTQPALKTWTSINPPAASHRWRTLQLYLKEQAHYLELEHKAKLTTQVENERVEQAIRTSLQNIDQLRSSQGSMGEKTLPILNGVHHKNRNPSRQSTILSNGMMLETVDISKDEKLAASKGRASESKNRHSISSRRFSSASATRNGFSQSPVTPLHASPSFGTYNNSTDMLANVPVSAPHYLTSSGSASPRPPSPSRFSVRSGFAESMGRPFSRWSRNRRSTSQSILSFAPSGSMIDMHIGLSHDRHNMSQTELTSPQLFPNQSNTSAVILTPPPTSSARQKSRSKKALNGFLMKLGIKRHKSTDAVRVNPTQLTNHDELDNEPLAPPPSLSLLAREQQSSHRRNPSCLSLPNQRLPLRSAHHSNGLTSPISQTNGSRSPNNNLYFSTITDDDDEELIDGPCLPVSNFPNRRGSKLSRHEELSTYPQETTQEGCSRSSTTGVPFENGSRSHELEETNQEEVQKNPMKSSNGKIFKHHSIQKLMSKSMSMLTSSTQQNHRRQSVSSNLTSQTQVLNANQHQNLGTNEEERMSFSNENGMNGIGMNLNEKSRRSDTTTPTSTTTSLNNLAGNGNARIGS
ncbi:uncharacterized protein MELLADRAFT_90271 [Melampsora larici-populina 98AG31]|uniref:Uncharacterized protein n=1 Tax=Melampsora larici-populina (strain 98AG31 / pathotype 3-4-7) TaxID=747676 RepID=F4RWC0_MELLP|nr:uncharacterized protein MELLADRAFT_90271 [Melampsora larici-populina 98AG31]EGG03257.1 hypothetical protein MELLADRAFT_90271 [Melampsora larici-populina 98AG31]